MTPLVLIHGFTGSPSSFDLVLDDLDEARHVLSPTLSGHGTGSVMTHVASFREEVDRIATRIASWAEEPVHVVGYSLGARVALGMLVHHPGLFCRATLIGLNPGLEDPQERATRAAADDRWRAVLDRGDLDAFIAAWSTQPLFATQQRLPEEILDRQHRERLCHTALGLSHSLQVLGLAAMPSYWTALGRISQPLDLLVGEDDTKFLAIAHQVADHFPAIRVHTIAGAGHNLLLEAPDEVAQIIRKGIAP